jgi:hypothetical protein
MDQNENTQNENTQDQKDKIVELKVEEAEQVVGGNAPTPTVRRERREEIPVAKM